MDAGSNADGVQQEPSRLIEARDVHARVHVAGEIVLRSQYRALESVNPLSHDAAFRYSPFAFRFQAEEIW